MMRTLWLLAALLLCATQASAEPVRLYWDPNTEVNLAGYQLYWGPAPGTYTQSIVIPKDASFAEVDLPPGTYTFAIKAFDSGGLYSGFSNTVTVTVIAAIGKPTLADVRVPTP